MIMKTNVVLHLFTFLILHAESGKECISWYDLDLHFSAPNNDLERNACRNAQLPPSFGFFGTLPF